VAGNPDGMPVYPPPVSALAGRNALDITVAAEAHERYRAVVSLIRAAGSQIGASGYPAIGSILFMNAVTIAGEITDHTADSPQLALTVDFIVSAFLQITAGRIPPEPDTAELFPDAYK
jgi:hypothetical protein